MKKVYKVLSSVALAGIIGATTLGYSQTPTSAASVDKTVSATEKAATTAPAAAVKKAEQTLKKITGTAYKLDQSDFLGGTEWSYSVKKSPNSYVLIDAKGKISSASISTGKMTYHIQEDKLSHTSESIQLETVDSSVQRAVDAVFDKMEGVEQGKLSGVSLIKKGAKQVYEFMFVDGEFGTWIEIDKKTLNVQSVNARALADDLFEKDQEVIDKYEKSIKALTEKELLAQAAEQAEAWLGVDLTGYKATKGAFPSDRVVFEKKGAPTIVGNFNSDGLFYSIGVKYL
ncbi:hypothetical protein [Paenibacillus xylanilyticus]|uniref:Uncharacterized protein n=1 Tax=Paenibacillus xylanilyticus TaxID=248903 RepID=A0A7Y6BUF6_9BACL|nr:hypothetical protein [Paenibacillus xylanilyticus]NUU74375.1 hypothetical protein [Paenibacillus xylanilyticus]